MIAFFKNYKLTLLGSLIGAAGGYVYYYFVGCNSGSCAISSSPINSAIYGVLMGGLLFNTIESNFKK